MTLDMKKIAERKLSELLVEMVNGDNIIKCRPVQIALCRSIFQQILIACNEREITIAVQNCRRLCTKALFLLSAISLWHFRCPVLY